MSQIIKVNNKNVSKADLVVGIPSLNEADNIAFVAQQASKGLREYFPKLSAVIINVDNYSGDGTRDAFLNAKTRVPKIYISTPPRVMGKGNNFYNLFREAEGLGAKAIAVIDADIKSITPEWIKTLLTPVLKSRYDFVTPLYARNEYDGTITNSICYPLIASILGLDLRQPIGGEFALSRKLSGHLLKQEWSKVIKHYGVDIFMTLNALVGDFKVCQVGLGQKIHKPSAPKLGPMFTQVVETLFDILIANKNKWTVDKRVKIIPLYRKSALGPPQDLPVSYKGMKHTSQYEFSINKEILERALTKDIYAELDHMFKKKKIRITADLWSRIIYDILYSYDKTDMNADLIEALKPLYFGRNLTFIRDTLDLSHDDSEGKIQEQVDTFIKNKNYFLAKYHLAPSIVEKIAGRIPLLKNGAEPRRAFSH